MKSKVCNQQTATNPGPSSTLRASALADGKQPNNLSDCTIIMFTLSVWLCNLSDSAFYLIALYSCSNVHFIWLCNLSDSALYLIALYSCSNVHFIWLCKLFASACYLIAQYSCSKVQRLCQRPTLLTPSLGPPPPRHSLATFSCTGFNTLHQV